MTSNVGAREVKDFGSGVGFKASYGTQASGDKSKSLIEGALKRVFRPEFLNRVDDVVFFLLWRKSTSSRSSTCTLAKVFKRINTMGFEVKLTDKAKDYIADKGLTSNLVPVR
jgi:ATP-dependent Clp protease ATP-binding subunit ClpC